MKSTTFIHLIALPAILANFLELVIVDEKGTFAAVTGKVDADGEMLGMDRETPWFDQTAKCLDENQEWNRWICGGQKRTEYQQVGQFNFTEATKDPRQFVVEVARDEESGSYVQVCDITVIGEGFYTWDVTWNVTASFLGYKDDSAIQIHCGEQLTHDEVFKQSRSGTDQEKELWEEVMKASEARQAEKAAATEAAA